ncbi:hypothetical protein [Thalassotalea profundi]|uniref:DUF4398 domain-containing protein n=1 Tax=Thalassotalea profundi TaxID=2036687 RepID=A0ABQ3IR40_9GAMM|nr:hypothetical protein [Thalassotalea profundi]GHE91502.1 hypothetical protein GCM10011501_21100 [Thalassotalea profundi]
MSTLIIPVTIIRATLLSAFIMLVSGCQILSTAENDTNTEYSYYGSYYLWIKSLNDEELVKEINAQQVKESEGDQTAEYHLLLLHSLPNSPIHNPYIAKAKLNQQALIQEAQTQFNVGDLAFIVMLRDQLNQQLLMLNKLINKEKTNTENKKQLAVQQQSIEALEQRSQKLQQQIEQLKKIESSISDHGTTL